MARGRLKLPDWRTWLFWSGVVAFLGYWVFSLHNDFQTLDRLSHKDKYLSRLLKDETLRAEENVNRLEALQKGEGWEDLVRKELRYVKEGEILIRPVPKPGVTQPKILEMKIR